MSHNHIDDYVDNDLFSFLNKENMSSFFLSAGAGSGKTRSLVTLLNNLRNAKGNIYKERNQRIAVITYRNAASNEIERRLGYDSLFSVSTIHSFVWQQIQYYTKDIKEYLRISYDRKFQDLTEKEANGHSGSAASYKRIDDIKKLNAKKEFLDNIRKFIYDPLGTNNTKNALSHSEVLDIAVGFLVQKDLFQQIFKSKYPILLIDECQDTQKKLIEAFIKLVEENIGNFAIGLFGDMMQRIFFSGKSDLMQAIPSYWKKPRKKMNHRSPKRIVNLNNCIRKNIDGLEQLPRTDAKRGFVHFFLYPQNCDKQQVELEVRLKMAELCQDEKWETSVM